MRRLLPALGTVLCLGLFPALASAEASSPGEGSHGGPMVVVAGTVVSVDASSGSLVASAFLATPSHHHEGPGEGGGGDNHYTDPFGGGTHYTDPFRGRAADGAGGSPAAQQVTITTDGSTVVRVNDHRGAVGDLAPGDRFYALYKASPSDSLQTVVSQPAAAVLARSAPKRHHQLYAFVGTVTGVDSAAGTLTVNVSHSLPVSLVAAGSGPVTFTVGPHTLVLGDSGSGLGGGSLDSVQVGDVVAGGLVADRGLSLDQVSALPLRVLLDMPVSGDGGSKAVSSAKARALHRALTLLGDRSGAKGKGHRASKPKARHRAHHTGRPKHASGRAHAGHAHH